MGITVSATHHPITKLDLGILSNELNGQFFYFERVFVLGSFRKLFDTLFDLLPPANEVWAKVISYTCFSFCSRGGGGVRGCGWACVVVGGHAWLQGCEHGCGGVCVVVGGMHGCRGVHGCRRGMHGWGHAWLWGGAWLRGGACVGYDEIRSMSGGVRILLECILVSLCNDRGPGFLIECHIY